MNSVENVIKEQTELKKFNDSFEEMSEVMCIMNSLGLICLWMWVSVDGCARWPTSPGARIPHDIGSPDSGKGTKVPLQKNLSVDEYEHRGKRLIMRRRGDIRSLVWLGGPPPHSQACSMRSIQECTSAMEVASHRCRHQRPISAERQTIESGQLRLGRQRS